MVDLRKKIGIGVKLLSDSGIAIANEAIKNTEVYQELESTLHDLEKELNTLKNKSNQRYLPEDEIIYLTGMSINKKTFHQIYELMSNDKDFDSAFDILEKNINAVNKSNIQEVIGLNKEISPGVPIVQAVGKGALVTGMSMVTGIPPLVLTGFLAHILDVNSDNKNEKIQENLNNINHGVFKEELFGRIFNKKNELIQTINNLSWSNFFSIFQSNQSDIRGLNALTSENNLHDKFVLHYGYADKPFYENLFINSLNVTFTDNFLSKVDKDEILLIYNNAYQEHIHDIVLGKILKNDIIEIASENKKIKLEKQLTDGVVKILKDGFDNRNLFGIDLISRFLLTLIQKINFHEKIKVYVDTSFITEEHVKQKYEIKSDDKSLIAEKQALEVSIIKSFTEEIWEYSSSPVYFKFVDDEREADIKINAQYLNKEDFFPSNEQLSEYAESLLSIKIPIKMFISLPIYLTEKGEQIPTRDFIVPERSIHNAKDNGTINIYTVGGIEHNRPLMRLVNIHRQQESDKRILGFFDNRFDYQHKINHRGEDNFFHYFLMGANQLVSGLNSDPFRRFDDNTGNSISSDAKIIYFNINEKNSQFTTDGTDLKYHIVSIYGFSALASAYATLWSIINIKESLDYIDSNDEYQSSLAFKALDVSDKNKIENELSVFTKRVRFLEMSIMEKRLKEICYGLEPFTYLRLEYLKPKDQRSLIEFMYGINERGKFKKAEAVDKVEDGSSTAKQNKV